MLPEVRLRSPWQHRVFRSLDSFDPGDEPGVMPKTEDFPEYMSNASVDEEDLENIFCFFGDSIYGTHQYLRERQWRKWKKQNGSGYSRT